MPVNVAASLHSPALLGATKLGMYHREVNGSGQPQTYSMPYYARFVTAAHFLDKYLQIVPSNQHMANAPD
jgi:hypothetical protein